MKNQHPENPFLWKNIERPSIFLRDPYFRATVNHAVKQTQVVERERKGGRDIGYIPGLRTTNVYSRA